MFEYTVKIASGCTRIYPIDVSPPYKVPEFVRIHSFPQENWIYPQNTLPFAEFLHPKQDFIP
jgi:hypothetical protein